MSTFHLYPHSEIIANSSTERFEDMLRWLYKTDKANRDTWRAWSREKFVEHLRLVRCIRNFQTRLTRATMR